MAATKDQLRRALLRILPYMAGHHEALDCDDHMLPDDHPDKGKCGTCDAIKYAHIILK